MTVRFREPHDDGRQRPLRVTMVRWTTDDARVVTTVSDTSFRGTPRHWVSGHVIGSRVTSSGLVLWIVSIWMSVISRPVFVGGTQSYRGNIMQTSAVVWVLLRLRTYLIIEHNI